MTPTYFLLGCILSYLHLGHTSNSIHLCKDTGCLTNFANQGVEAQCVNVLYANWTSMGEKYDLSTVMEDGLCDGACCRCFKHRQHNCTDVTGKCRAAFGGKGSCIDARTGDLSNIDTLVKPKGGLCGAGSDKCCECFKLKTEGFLMAIGGSAGKMVDGFGKISSVEVVNTSCNFNPPKARCNHKGVTTTDGMTLVCGGYTNGPTESCLKFDYRSKTWEQYYSLRNKYVGLTAMIELKNGIYVFGTIIGNGNNHTSEFLAKGSSVWTQGPNIRARGYYSCAAKVSDHEFVILGGMGDSGEGRQALVYNELSGKWREWPRLNVSVHSHSCLGLGDIVLMAGGISNHSFTGRTVIFDTKTGSAREVASLKYPRGNPGMALYRGKPLILGGQQSGLDELRSDGEIWNMDTETWEEADIHLNTARFDFPLLNTVEEIDCE